MPKTLFSLRLRRDRVPVTLQMSAVECGAACLAMVLAYHGRDTSLKECNEDCGTSRDGVTAQDIFRAARKHSLHPLALSLGATALRGLSLPAIVHWSFSHFVVLERCDRNRVAIVDPAVGRRTLTLEEFSAGFTGVVLTFEPGTHFTRRTMPGRLTFQTCLRYVWRVPGIAGLFAQVLGASLCLQFLGLALPVSTKLIADRIIPSGLRDALPLLGAGLLVFALAQALTTALRGLVLNCVQARLDMRILVGFVEQLLRLPFRFFQQRATGDLLMRITSSATIREVLTNQTISGILDGAFVLGYLGIFFWRAPLFGLLLLGIMLAQIVLTVAASGPVRDATQRELLAQADAQSYLVQALMGIATVKASGAEPRVLGHWSNLVTAQVNASVRRGHLAALVDAALSLLRTISPLLLLWLAAGRVLDGAMSIGTMFALIALASAVFVPLSALLSNAQRIQLVRAHIQRLGDIVEAEPEQSPRSADGVPSIRGSIRVNHVSFRYDVHAPFLLRDISLSIDPGQKIALVGRTGSGKTTLAMLLLGLLEPVEGEILYEGRPLRELCYRSLRKQMGVVLQEPFLFSGSIRQNIAFNDPALSLDRVMDAARLAAIHDDIAAMPMGYETRLSEGGSGLSGGQRQRLALARALAHRPSVLIIDEGTSHLDSATESLVENNLSQLRCTRILIAHRLNTVRNADRIFVLSDGTIAEQGRHSELLESGGHYAALVRNQLAATLDQAGTGQVRVSTCRVEAAHAQKPSTPNFAAGSSASQQAVPPVRLSTTGVE